jgi:hypothetical protein
MAEIEAGGILPQGFADAITRGVQQGFQPGPISPSNPTRMYPGAGGAGPRAQPQIAPAAVPPATAAPPQGAAPPPARPGGPRTVEAIPPRPVDPLHLGGENLHAQMQNIFNQLDDIREERPLTPQEQRSYAQARQYLMTPRVQPDGSTYYPGEPVSRRQADGAPAPAAAPPSASGAPPAGGAPAAPAPAATPPADSRPPSQVARPGDPVVPDGMYRTRAGTGYVDRPLQQQPTIVVTELNNNVGALNLIDRTMQSIQSYEGAVGMGAAFWNAMPLGDLINQRRDPAGTEARSHIANLRSTTIHERSGASQTLSEVATLRDVIPNIGDTPETIRSKLAGLRQALQNITGGLYEAYSPRANYRELPHVERVVNPPEPPPTAFRPTPYLPNGQVDTSADSGVRDQQVYHLQIPATDTSPARETYGRWDRTAMRFRELVWRNGRWANAPEPERGR